MTMQKDKGKAFETKTAKFIHDYLYKNNDEYKQIYDSLGNVNLKPRREHSSGTVKESDNDIDLGIALKFFPYSIECKHHKIVTETTLNSVLTNKFSWIEQVMKQANTHGSIKKLVPLIVFRGNYTSDLCCVRLQDKPELLEKVYKNNIDFVVYHNYIIVEFEKLIPFLVM